jgi:hypothetical protein
VSLTKVYPNPAISNASISFYNKQEEKVVIRVFNAGGTMVRTLANKIFPAGNNQVTFDTNGLVNAVYFIKVESIGNSTTLRLVKE